MMKFRKTYSMRAGVLMGLLVLTLHPAFQSNLRTATAQIRPNQPELLAVKRPVERELTPGAKCLFRLQIKAGTYLSLQVEQRGIDVITRLIGPDGKTLATRDVTHDVRGTETLDRIISKSGTYRVEIIPAGQPLRPGKFEIQLRETRPAVPTDPIALALAAEMDQVTDLRQERKLAEALALQRQIMETCERKLPAGHPTRNTSLNNLGVLLMESGQPREAEALLQNALDLTEKTLGPDHLETLTQLQNLGNLYKDLGKYPEAESCLRRALALSEKIRGPQDLETADCLNFLATLLVTTKKLATTEDMLQQALAIREKELGPTHAKVGETLNDIGFMLLTKGDYKPAADYLQRALAVREQALGKNHPVVAETPG